MTRVKRYVDVVAEVQGRDLGAVAADITSRLQQVQFPLEYHARVLGEYAAPQAARTRLLVFVIAAAIGVFFLLQAAFGSWRLAALSCLTLPAALVGGLLAALATAAASFHWVRSPACSPCSELPCAAASCCLTTIQHLERHEGETFGPKLVICAEHANAWHRS